MKGYVVIDLEMCNAAKPNGQNFGYRGAEIIQIGAVRLDKNYDVVESYASFVQPEFTMISQRIEALTSIKMDDLEGAKFFKEAIYDFLEWLGDDEIVIVSWSDSDAGQIKAEMLKKNIQIPELDKYFASWVDSQKMFGDRIKRDKSYNLVQALNISDIEYKDGAHDAVVDAYNTALLFKKLQSKEEFTFSRYYYKERKEESLGYDLGNLLSGVELKED